MNRTNQVPLAVLGGGVVGALALLFSLPVTLVVGLAVVTAGCLWQTARNDVLRQSPSSWNRQRWTGAVTGVITLLGGVVWSLSLPTNLGLGLGLLVVGGCYLTFALGVELASTPEERPRTGRRERRSPGQQDADTS